MVSKHKDLTQAEEVNDSGQKLPKVSPKDGDIVHFTDRNFVKAFKRLPWRVFEVMVGLVCEGVSDNGRKLPKVPPKMARVFITVI